ncbi:hypothetical protein [Phaeocystidibacter marisrubri]|uniref:Uncharacterized protein n=1 Tax=Phaeocystidibacter marisrubri TaxID=1577780 RepID=A0A6L3ZIX9_9FLAO|nr:hypothetical protein [Phaeocystidibacter marisrubri]KAB2817972.1 hypothetical protein F8C82_06090 [Phaeocystidibacter marisrubri]GGH72607.1 hypothetical protein GCM10011318_16730 [Phaeocystidibacter marisrubri]
MMKYALSLVVVALLFGKTSHALYTIEDKLYSCYKDAFMDMGLDIDSSTTAFETALIEAHVLMNNSGEAYLRYFSTLAETGEFPEYEASESFISPNQLATLHTSHVRCIYACKASDSSTFYSSKFYELQHSLQSMDWTMDSMVFKIASKHLKILSTKDFEHPYYKLRTLIAIYRTSDMDRGLYHLLPRKPKRLTSLREDQIARLRIDSADRISLNGRYMEGYALQVELKNFIEAHRRDHQIQLIADQKTTYSAYILLTDLVHEVYLQLRSDLAYSEFEKPIEECSKEELDFLKEQLPMNVHEMDTKL